MDDVDSQPQQPQGEASQDSSQPVEQQQAPKSTPQQPLETTSPPQRKKWLLPTLIGVVVLVLCAAGYIVYKNFQSNSEQILQAQPTTVPTQSILTPTSTPATNLKIYSDEKYSYSFSYPKEWKLESQEDLGQSLTGIAENHTISIRVWRVTGFGYCYKYGDRKEIIVGGKSAETADGVGGTEMCEEDMTNRGNTFVLIPLKENDTRPPNQIHISYDYPLSDKNLAESNLNQILTTIKIQDVPSGYSSNTIDVKFSGGTDVSKPENLLSSSLMNSVSSIMPLVSLSDEQLQKIDASEMKLWMRITLKINTDSKAFLKDLRSQPNVKAAEFSPLPAPPPEG